MKPARFPMLFLLVLWCIGCSTSATKLKETEQHGNQIIQALKQYDSDNGQFPTNLTDLSPKYLNSIPQPTWGMKQWQYESDGKDFTLKVDESIHTGDGDSQWFKYLGDRHGWQLGD